MSLNFLPFAVQESCPVCSNFISQVDSKVILHLQSHALDRLSLLSKEQRSDALRDKKGHDACRFIAMRTAFRWLPQDDGPFAARCAALCQRGHILSNQFGSMFFRVADSRGGEQERERAVVIERGNPLKSSQDQCNVRAKNAAVGMTLINDHPAQMLQKAVPATVIWKNGAVQHIRRRHQNLHALSERRALRSRRIPGKPFNDSVWIPGSKRLVPLFNKRASGSQAQQRRVWLASSRFEIGKGCSECLARGSWGRERNMLAVKRCSRSFFLMAV